MSTHKFIHFLGWTGCEPNLWLDFTTPGSRTVVGCACLQFLEFWFHNSEPLENIASPLKTAWCNGDVHHDFVVLPAWYDAASEWLLYYHRSVFSGVQSIWSLGSDSSGGSSFSILGTYWFDWGSPELVGGEWWMMRHLGWERWDVGG